MTVDARHLATLLSEALVQVLEESAFVLAEVTDSPRTPDDPVCVRIPFHSPHRGQLYLACPGGWAAQLAEDILEEDLQPVEIIGEFLNMASGIMFERWLGPDERYELGTPERCGYSELEKCGCTAGVETDEGIPLVVGVSVEE